jgi:hypothetical protein
LFVERLTISFERLTFCTAHLQHRQKALEQMNLQIQAVLSNLDGTTGLAIIDAIRSSWLNCVTRAFAPAKKPS